MHIVFPRSPGRPLRAIGLTIVFLLTIAAAWLGHAAAQSDEGAAASSRQSLRYHVPFATFDNSTVNLVCTTVVNVKNVSNDDTTIEVDWVEFNGTVLDTSATTVPSGESASFFVTDSDGSLVDPEPFEIGFGSTAQIGNFDGSATVHSPEPRILATAHLVCRDAEGGSANLVDAIPVTVVPVGSTLEFFTAGIGLPRAKVSG